MALASRQHLRAGILSQSRVLQDLAEPAARFKASSTILYVYMYVLVCVRTHMCGCVSMSQRSSSGVVPHMPASLFLETGTLPGLELTRRTRLVGQ